MEVKGFKKNQKINDGKEEEDEVEDSRDKEGINILKENHQSFFLGNHQPRSQV